MARKFTVNAHQKIQAAPVDFDALDDYANPPPSMSELVKQEIENNKASLIAYAEAKFKPLEAQINADIEKCIAKYVDNDEDAMVEFADCISPYASAGEKTYLVSSILPKLSYSHLDCAEDIWLSIGFSSKGIDVDSRRYESFLGGNIPDSDLYLLLDEGRPMFYIADSQLFILLLEYLLTEEEVANELELDSVVDICEQLIYEYCDFVDNCCSEKLMNGVRKYIDKHKGE